MRKKPKRLTFGEQMKIVEWLRKHDRQLVMDDCTFEQAYQRCKADMGEMEPTIPNFNFCRKQIEMKWSPKIVRAAQIVPSHLQAIGFSLEQVLTYLEMEVPFEVKLLADKYREENSE